jgi:hypothetical protein
MVLFHELQEWQMEGVIVMPDAQYRCGRESFDRRFFHKHFSPIQERARL